MCTPKVVTNTLVADTAPGASAGDYHLSSSSLLLAALPSAALLRNVTDAEKEQQAVLLKQLQERSQDASSVKESNPVMHQVAARTNTPDWKVEKGIDPKRRGFYRQFLLLRVIRRMITGSYY